jgi:hypothetical protein
VLTHTGNLKGALCNIRKALCRNRKALCRKNKSAPLNKSAPMVIVAPTTIIKALCTHFKIKALLQMILQNILEIQ